MIFVVCVNNITNYIFSISIISCWKLGFLRSGVVEALKNKENSGGRSQLFFGECVGRVLEKI